MKLRVLRGGTVEGIYEGNEGKDKEGLTLRLMGGMRVKLECLGV